MIQKQQFYKVRIMNYIYKYLFSFINGLNLSSISHKLCKHIKYSIFIIYTKRLRLRNIINILNGIKNGMEINVK